MKSAVKPWNTPSSSWAASTCTAERDPTAAWDCSIYPLRHGKSCFHQPSHSLRGTVVPRQGSDDQIAPATCCSTAAADGSTMWLRNIGDGQIVHASTERTGIKTSLQLPQTGKIVSLL